MKDALRRLPGGLDNSRMFHIRRAPHLILRHQTLPRKQQTKYEDKCEGDKFSLEPYLKDVLWGREEREDWAKE